MPRAVWKGPFINVILPKDPTLPIKTQSRATTIIPEFIGRTFMVHNGRDYIPVSVTEQMVNHKLGEFSPTRKPYTPKKNSGKS